MTGAALPILTEQTCEKPRPVARAGLVVGRQSLRRVGRDQIRLNVSPSSSSNRLA